VRGPRWTWAKRGAIWGDLIVVDDLSVDFDCLDLQVHVLGLASYSVRLDERVMRSVKFSQISSPH
jgi:hypothetical protein